ncbi:glycosyl hydrolase family 61-domain-containing protein [Apiospora kogelbergensis]|uniref:glycosyl hydrolase family 61-domain-containing protein n=1 Tax=Apiospora kogelbergensis TaxID=1337665 RepID=UPI00312E4E56
MRYSIVNALAFATTVAAHCQVTEIQVNGKSQGTGLNKYIRSPPNNSPVKSLTTPNLVCGVNGAKAAPSFVAAAAGDTVTFEWMHDKKGDDIIDGSHKGPIITYIAPYTEDNGAGAIWSKIDEEGLTGGKWAVDNLIAAKGKKDVKLPADLKAGKYLVRQEIIALHEADAAPTESGRGAQFYPSCAQFEVTGTGSAVPDQKFDIQSYSGTDPGIKFNIYNSPTSYKVPGPAIWSAAASGGGAGGAAPAAPAAPSSPAGGSAAPKPTSAAGGGAATSAPAASPTTLLTSTKAAGGASPTAPATGGGAAGGSGAAMYAQCGGNGFSGATSCAEGTCKKQNDYYSQCVPN